MTILVTGATGFLGGAVAAELLGRHPGCELLFLVRAKDSADGLGKLRQSVGRFRVGAHALARLSEASVVCGDLATFSALLDEARITRVTHVLNCAAMVSFARKRDVWKTNFDDTLAFARAAALLPRLRRFVHVSTAMVCGATSDQLVREDDFPGDARQFTVYTRSKAAIEQQLPAVLDGTLTVARPSVIVGHTRLGCDPSSSIFWLFRMIHASRRVPFSPATRIDVVPVDFCASSLIHLLEQSTLPFVCYHVSAGPQASCSFAEIDAAMSNADERPEAEPLEQFDIRDLSHLEPHFERWFGPCDPKRAAHAIQAYCAFAGLNVVFDNSRLTDAGGAAAPPLTGYVGECARTARFCGIAEQMQSDAR